MTKAAKRLGAFAFTLTSLISVSGAQGIDFGQASQIGAESSLLPFLNQVLLTYEVNSIGEFFFFFLLPLAGFYLINTNIFESGFEVFKDRIGNDNLRNRDDIPTGLRGISFVGAFLTVQVAGVAGTAVILLATGLGFTGWFLNQIGLLQEWNMGGRAGGREDDNGGVPEEYQERLEQVEEELGAAEDEEQDAAENGNEDEAEEAERTIENAVASIKDISNSFDQALQVRISELESAVGDIRNAGGNSIEDFKKIDQRAAQIENQTEAILNNLPAGGNAPQVPPPPGNTTNDWGQTVAKQSYDNFNFKKKVKKISEDIERVYTRSAISDSDYRDELDELIDITNHFSGVKSFVERLPRDLDDALEDEEFLEELAREAQNQRILRRARNTEQQIHDIKVGLDHLERHEQALEELLREAEEELENRLQIEQQEMEDVEEAISGTDGIIENLQEMQNRLSSYNNTSSIEDDIDQMLQMLDQSEDVLNLLERELGHLHERERGVLSRLRNIFG